MMVADFHRAGEQEIRTEPSFPDLNTRSLRFDLIEEELNELEFADSKDDIVEVADALTDLLYVVYGAGHAYGIDLDKCFAEVHRSNMTKFPNGKAIRNEAGKVMKPASYEKPNLKKVLGLE
jgi:predicted HAD superfamily Cof-like phosphohydrolase